MGFDHCENVRYHVMLKTPKGLVLTYMKFKTKGGAEAVLKYLDKVKKMLEGWEYWGEINDISKNDV